jgi:halocyanin-like protein
MTEDSTRRRYLQFALVAAAGGLAGCSNDGSGTAAPTDDPTETSTDDASTPAGSTPTDPTPDDTTPTDQRPTIDDPQRAIDNWLSNTDTYEGEILDYQDESNVVIQVGAESSNSGNFAFDPPAIRIAEGTDVQWQWSGEGGQHNVVERYGAFDSGTPDDSSGRTWSRTFDTPGVYMYRCENHGGSLGGRGAIIVESSNSLSGSPKVDEWLEGYDYDGTLTDKTGRDTVTIEVGARGNDGYYSFDPIAVRVSAGTEIVFEWSGRGGSHDVTWEDGNLDDLALAGSADHSASVTVTEPGDYRYLCRNHRPGSGRGAIVVE